MEIDVYSDQDRSSESYVEYQNLPQHDNIETSHSSNTFPPEIVNYLPRTQFLNRNENLQEEFSGNHPVLSQAEENSNENFTSQVDANDCDESENDDPPSKKLAVSEYEDSEDEGKLCPICLDNWTNSGEHRICSLKCGHLFGLSCVNRWLASQVKKSCPTCKSKVSRHDIRHIYAKKLIAMDTTELENVKEHLKTITQERNLLQEKLTKSLYKEYVAAQQIGKLKKQIDFLMSAIDTKQISERSSSSTNISDNHVRLFKDRSLDICKEGGCRVIDCNSRMGLLVASMKSPNNIFSGFGVRKIDIANYKSTAFIPLHTKPIRDVRFHPQKQWLLSVALDKSIKVVDYQTNSAVCSYNGDVPLWSCCWDISNQHLFYVGEQQGSISAFDVRQMGHRVNILSAPGDLSPVVSVASVAVNPGSILPLGGVLSCKLNSLWVFENTTSGYVCNPMPVDGPFVSMSYQNSTTQLLVSTRPSSRYPHARHLLTNINKSGDGFVSETVHTFEGGSTQKLLTRSCFVSDKSDYIAAHDETLNTICLWSVNTGRKVCTVSAHSAILDLCGVQMNYANFLISLSDKKLDFYKFA